MLVSSDNQLPLPFMIYLDTAASYPVLPEVQQALFDAFKFSFANSASSHKLGVEVSDEIQRVRELIADEIGAYPSEIVFTSGATESNNIAFKSLLFGGSVPSNKKHIVTSQIEHKCIFAICSYLETQGFEITYIKPNENGIITAEAVSESLREDTAIVSIMHANNELGTINPITEIGELCFSKGVLFHSDCAQSFMKEEIDVDDMNIDVLSLSAHKIAGPKGIGAVYIRDLRKKHLQPVIHGAGQEDGLRGGTVAAPLIIGFGKAVELFPRYYSDFKKTEAKDYLINKLDSNDIRFSVNGNSTTLPSCMSLTLHDTNTSLLIRQQDDQFCIAQGSACTSKTIEPSHVLTALGMPREQADKTFRVSFPLDITRDEISTFVEAIKKATI
ncbi:cysteine desulfurase family protein [Parashewanella tropica]|uniref:cysteine desulfurase family protein n=1 Tax=Parashewanella tropica TaxID=2547970 RepID=UPI001FE70A31|nr:cysteine desulfurase family protein [Parashewanella tropica]